MQKPDIIAYFGWAIMSGRFCPWAILSGNPQSHGESVIQYSASLKELSSTCNFGELNDEMIPRIQERLQMEPDTLTLELTIIIVTHIGTAIKEVKNFQSDNSKFSKMKSGLDHESTKVQGIYHGQNRTKMQGNKNYSSNSNQKPSQQYKNIKGGNCGSANHRSRSSECPANNKTCQSCGHFSNMCCSIRSVKHIDEPEISIFSVSKRNKESAFKHCHVIIDGKMFTSS